MNGTYEIGRGARRSLRALATAVLAALTVVIAVSTGVSPAHAASRVDVSTTPAADGSTVVTLSGSGFQYLPNAPGGIYVFFGAVSDPATNAWAPSQGGQSGRTFSYANTSGSTLLVGFAGGSSADSANAVIDASGSWSAQMTIPGARFTGSYGDPHSGGAQTGNEIDCLAVQCGIITIGAHGGVNANNESFTPVSFVTADGSVLSGSGAQSFTDEATVLQLPQAQHPDEAEPGDEGTLAADAAAQDSGLETGEDAGFDTTVLVLGVLGAAVLALIAAIVAVAVKRSRAKKNDSASPLEQAAPEASTHTHAEEGADAR